MLNRVVNCEIFAGTFCEGISDEQFKDGEIVEIIASVGKVCTVFNYWKIKKINGTVTTNICEKALIELEILPKELFVI